LPDTLPPNQRELYLSALRPPPGFQFDRAIGNTYSLDLITLLSLPLSFALLDMTNGAGTSAHRCRGGAGTYKAIEIEVPNSATHASIPSTQYRTSRRGIFVTLTSRVARMVDLISRRSGRLNLRAIATDR